MKILHFLLATGLSLLGASLLSAAPASAPKAQTYALAGFCTRGKPPADLVEQAARAVESRTAGMKLVADPEEADHYVEVLFLRDSFEVYVDALPLAGRRVGSQQPSAFDHARPPEYNLELADIANTERAMGISGR